MLVIGVAGGTGSGKTTVVRKIQQQFPKGEVNVLSHEIQELIAPLTDDLDPQGRDEGNFRILGVAPGERVIVKGKKIYFRKNTIKANVSMERENGEIICFGILSGVGVDQ